MLAVRIIALVLLLLIFLQDLRGRAVYWFLFPLLAAALFFCRFDRPAVIADRVHAILINIGFIAIQLLILTVYFSLRARRWVNITARLLGLGDILFLVCMALYFPVLSFLLFYVASLTGALLFWLAWQSLSGIRDRYIPLAGLQALMMLILLSGCWWSGSFDLADDTWLLNLIAK